MVDADNPEGQVRPEEKIQRAAEKLSEIRDRPCLIFISSRIHRSDCLRVNRQLNRLEPDREAVDVILSSPGGDAHSAYLVVRQLRRKFDQVTVFVPLIATSAATLICLGADEIVLGEWGELGPLDAQLPEAREGEGIDLKSALNRFKALEQIRRYTLESFDLATQLVIAQTGMKIGEAARLGIRFAEIVSGPLFAQIDPIRLGESERSLDIGTEYGRRILGRYSGFSEDEARQILDRLVRGYPSHSFILDLEELSEVGLPARMPTEGENIILDVVVDALLNLRGEIFEVIEFSEEQDDADAVADQPEAEH